MKPILKITLDNIEDLYKLLEVCKWDIEDNSIYNTDGCEMGMVNFTINQPSLIIEADIHGYKFTTDNKFTELFQALEICKQESFKKGND